MNSSANKVSPLLSEPSASFLIRVCAVKRDKSALDKLISPRSNNETSSHISDDPTVREGGTETVADIDVVSSENSSLAAQNTVEETKTSDSVSEVRRMSFF
jgi:hypothetical protein